MPTALHHRRTVGGIGWCNAVGIGTLRFVSGFSDNEPVHRYVSAYGAWPGDPGHRTPGQSVGWVSEAPPIFFYEAGTGVAGTKIYR